jgi:hypothetical protein
MVRSAKRGCIRTQRPLDKHIPVDLVGYDVDLIPEKASVQCRRFDPATGKAFWLSDLCRLTAFFL